MSNLEKAYHWANLVLNPIILALILVSTSQTEPLAALGAGWALISAILNPKIRAWVIGSFASIMGATILLSCVGSIVGIFVLIFVASIGITVGFFIVLPVLWILSLKAIIDDRRGLI